MMNRLMTPREQLVIGFVGIALVLGSVTAIWLNRSDEVASDDSVAVVPDSPAVVAESEPAAAAVLAPPPAAPQPEPAAPTEIVVSVRGAVAQPGVYTMKPSDRVYDLIGRAGGLLEHAETDDINLAAMLIDGTTLTVPGDGQAEFHDGVVTLRGSSSGPAPNPPQYTVSGWSQAVQRTEVPGDKTPEIREIGVSAGSGETHSDRLDLNTATAEQLQELPGIGPVLAQSIVEYRANAPFTTVEQLQNVRGIGPKRFESLRDLVTVSL